MERKGQHLAGSPLGMGSEAFNVGLRLKLLREERKISMRALARRSSLSANALSMIERGLTSPSVGTLLKLARAMDIPITAFFRLEAPRSPVVHRKASDRMRIETAAGAWEELGGEAFSGRLEPLLITAPGNASSGPGALIHTGQELVYVLQGRMEFTVDGRRFLLEQEDALLFAASLPHRWRNPGPGPVKAVMVLAGFEDSERPSEYHLRETSNPVSIFDGKENGQGNGG